MLQFVARRSTRSVAVMPRRWTEAAASPQSPVLPHPISGAAVTVRQEGQARKAVKKYHKSERPYVVPSDIVNMSAMVAAGFDAEALRHHIVDEYGQATRKLNLAIYGTDYLRYTLDELIAAKIPQISDLASHVASHRLFFRRLAPGKNSIPRDRIADLIAKNFGTFSRFKVLFKEAAMNLFGSGYVWLCIDTDNVLHIVTCQNAQHPLHIPGMTGILCLDVWEHAYYAEHRNDRSAYIDKWFKIIDWDEVNRDV